MRPRPYTQGGPEASKPGTSEEASKVSASLWVSWHGEVEELWKQNLRGVAQDKAMRERLNLRM